jgi:hypothetical protein
VYCKNANLPFIYCHEFAMNLTIERKAVDSVKSVIRLDNLSEYQIEALSNLLRVEVTNNDCFISRPTGSEKSAV